MRKLLPKAAATVEAVDIMKCWRSFTALDGHDRRQRWRVHSTLHVYRSICRHSL